MTRLNQNYALGPLRALLLPLLMVALSLLALTHAFPLLLALTLAVPLLLALLLSFLAIIVVVRRW